MNERFVWFGDKETFFKELPKLLKVKKKHIEKISQEDLIKILKIFISESEFVDEIMDWSLEDMPEGTFGLIIPKYKLHVNLKQTSLYILSFLLDAKFTNGVVSLMASMSGKLGQAFNLLDESRGELCLVMSLLEISKDSFVEVKSLEKKLILKECTRNNLKCSQRYKGMCSINSNLIQQILDELESRKVLESNLLKKAYKVEK